MKKKILALAIGSILSAGVQAALSDIIITEAVDNKINYKNRALEITNTGSDSYTFTDNIQISKQINGGNWSLVTRDSDGESAVLGLTIAAGQVVVFHHGDADKALTDTIATNGGVAIPSKSMTGTGDDAFAIRDVVDATSPAADPEVLDVVGIIDDTVTDWGKDSTVSRKVTSTAQNKGAFVKNDPNWDVETTGSFAGLGLKPGEAVVVPPVVDTCSPQPQTTIAQVQGDSWSSPLIAEGEYNTGSTKYFVTGVVSAVTEGTKQGFYLFASDGDDNTSDGLFVKTKMATADMVGKTVCLESAVYEDYGMTQLDTDEWIVVDPTVTPVPATPLKLITEDITEVKKEVVKDVVVDGVTTQVTEEVTEYVTNFKHALERHEGMLVKFPADIDPDNVGHKDIAAKDGKKAITDQSMRVSRTFSFDYDYFRTNMVLSYNRTNMHPNQENTPGSQGSKDQAAENNDFRVILEMNKSSTTPDDLPYYPQFKADPAKNYIRVDDSVTGLEGVLVYRTGYDNNGHFAKPSDFTLIATDNNPDLKFIHNTDRKDASALAKSLDKVAEGDIEIKVATQNVLNYFNSPFGGDYNNHGENRGATSYSEYDKQKAKIISAIRGLDADIVGLMEIENNGFGKNGAIAELVNDINLYYDEPKLSKKYLPNSTSNRYAFIGFDSNGDVVIDSDDSIGGDAITSGMLYRPEKVSLDAVKIIPMPSQHDEPVVNNNGEIVKNYTNAVLESGDNYMRDSLAVTFKINQTGKKLTVAVNHLKSKGSTCAEDWDGIDLGDKTKLAFNEDKVMLGKSDYQGNCENFRVAAAVQLGDELAKIAGDKVIVGDMNSYAQEDPMLVLTEMPEGTTLTAARNTFIGKDPQFGANGAVITDADDYGYVNAVSKKDAENNKMSWSYSFGDAIGSLDHILISPSLEKRLVDATDWHINAAESTLYDYNEDKKGDDASLDTFYADDVYRSSDHDSAIMVLSYKPAETDGAPVHIAIEGGVASVPYMIPESAGAQEGDIASITVSPITEDLDMSKMLATPTVIAKASRYVWIDGKKVYPVNLKPSLAVLGLKTGEYAVSMSLTRDGAPVAGSAVSYNIDVAKADSLEPEVVVPEYDETGGSFGMFSIMSLLGLGFLRRRKA